MAIKIQLHSEFEIYAIIEKYDRVKVCENIRVFANCCITKEEHNIQFIELLNCFASGLLELEKEYEQKYPIDEQYNLYEGYSARIVRKNDKYYLKLSFFCNDYGMILSRYDCKVIVSNFNKIYSKCTRSELL